MELLLSWLNDDLQLSPPVTDMSSSFRNGFLLGEILYKHNQIASFTRFSRKQSADAKVQNFCLLEPVFRNLNIKFDSKTAYSIMQGDPGTVSKMVYQLKMTMERVEKFAAPVSMRDNTDNKKMLPCVPARPSHRDFNEKASRMFDKSIRNMIENQNDTLMEGTIGKYKVEEEKQKRDLEQIKVRRASEQHP